MNTLPPTIRLNDKITSPGNPVTNTVQPPLTATFFRTGGQKIHTLILVKTSLQRPLPSVPKVAVVWRFDCMLKNKKVAIRRINGKEERGLRCGWKG